MASDTLEFVSTIRGVGLHGGRPGCVRIRRRPEDGRGLRFFWPSGPVAPEALVAWSRQAKRSTRLKKGDAEIRAPEHLLAAALFFSECPLDLHCAAEEPPGLDGSSLPFYSALAAAAPEAARAPRWQERPADLSWEYAGPEGGLQAEPAPNFSVEYVWNCGPWDQRFRLADPAAAVREVLPARTFMLYRDWKICARDPDLLRGAGLESGLLLAESEAERLEAQTLFPDLLRADFPLLPTSLFRVDQELAKHKILDLLGDLALSGLRLPRLRLRIRNGGHALNHLLLERLQA